MLKQLAAFSLSALLLTTCAHGADLSLNGEPLDTVSPVYEDTTFVSLRSVVQALRPDADIRWEDDRAAARAAGLDLTARPGDDALVYNGQRVELGAAVRFEDFRTLVPLRPLAALLGAAVDWDPVTGHISLTTADASRPSWSEDDLYWLSRIISAESQGESWEGKIAVGNVVLNRVASPDFPDTVYDVIFDPRWGGQFEPVRNGTVYNEPTEESVRAAAACLNGANTAGDSLYFLAPTLTDNHWAMENCTYVTTIGTHWFYY